MMNRASTCLALFLVATPVYGIECLSKRGHDDSHWSWREIDGRKCWYRGPVGVPKFHFHWPSRDELEKKPAPKLSDADSVWPPLSQADRERYLLEDSVWPELPPASFDERFRGER